jgi:phage-related minor tail protein
MAKLGDLIVRVGVDTRGLNDKLGNVKKQMRQTTGQLTQMGKSLSMSLTAPLLGIGALAVKAATDFEFSMAKVQAVSGFTAAEMGRLETQAQELGASTSKSASDVGQLQLELAKLGKTSTEIEQMTEGVLSLSIAFDTELGETARVVGATLNQFGLEASESGRIVDNMATLFGSSALDLEQFNVSMRTVGSVASSMGLSVEQTGAALGVLVNSGVDASTAGTALTKSLVTLAQEGMSGTEAIEALTSGNLSVAQAFEVFGDRAGKVIPILQKRTEKYAELTQKQIEGTGAALKARKILEDTAQGGFDKLRSAVEALGISLGDALLPMVKQMTDAVAGFASRLAGMSDGTKTAVIVVGAMAAAIGPLLIILPNLVNGLKLVRLAQIKMNAAVLANPYVAAAAAVAVLSAAIYLYATRATQAEKIQKKLAEVSKNIESSYAKEASSMEFLRFQYKEAGGDLEKRKDLLDQIAVISPETVKDLDAETLSYDDLSNAIDGYLTNLKEKIRIQMGEEAITAALENQIKLEQERDALNKEATRTQFELTQAKKRDAEAVESGNLVEMGRARIALINLGSELAAGQALEQSKKANSAAIAANAKLLEDLTATYGANSSAADGNAASSAAASGGLDEVGNSADDAADAVATARGEMMELLKPLEAIPIKTEPLTQSLAGVSTAVSDMVSEIAPELQKLNEDVSNAINGAVESAVVGFSSMLGAGLATGQGMKGVGAMLLGVFADLAIQLGTLAIGYAIGIKAIKASLESLAWPIALAAGVALIALGSGLKGAISKSMGDAGVTPFADGGIVSGPTMGLVGEYPGAKTNPEVIAPLDKLRSMLGGQNVVVTGKISGRDILLTSERNAIDRNRVRGF